MSATMLTTTFRPVNERYTGWELIGSGGTAKVYRVNDEDLGIPLAIKVLDPALCRDPAQVNSVRQEVLISRALRHPNICPIHDLFEGPQGIGIVMDLLDGLDLRDWMVRNRGRLRDTLAARLEALRRIADALEVAHQLIVHRDLKPANIFLRGGDVTRPLIMDFGLSIRGNSRERGFAGGTPKYMAPEQYTAPATVTASADLFSFGVLAYELMTGGRLPASSLQHWPETRVVPWMTADLLVPPSRWCDAIPPALDRLILLLCQSDPALRPSSATELREALASIELRSSAPIVDVGEPIDVQSVEAGSHLLAYRAGFRDKRPREVHLSAFRIARHPVTNRQYRTFLDATGHRAPDAIEHPDFCQPDKPVVGVSWEDAAAFARWVGGRLPSEIEWEVAATAGQPASLYPWGGDEPTATRANIDRFCPATTPVQAYPAGRNAWGLWDCCGNVWEWCADAWDEGLFRRLRDGDANPSGTGDGVLRAVRGGSFDSFAVTGRCTFRGKEPAALTRADIGFRVAFDAV